MSAAVSRAFAADGPLSLAFPGYTPRSQQSAMAQAVAQAIETREPLVVEAATGTGKTLAYLVPALLSGQRTLISTGTRALQDQLFERDLPATRDALEIGGRIARLKGRSNYLCLYRMDQALDDGSLSPYLRRDLQRVRRWAGHTRDGDLAGVEGLQEDAPVRMQVSSTAENCLGQRCPRYEDCWVMDARRKAQAADVVVVNHHLLFADLALKDTGFAELLPGADIVIVDEAHQVPEIAGQFFGYAISARQLRELAGDSQREAEDAGLADAELVDALQAMSEAVDQLFRQLPHVGGRQAWESAFASAPALAALEALGAAQTTVCTRLDPLEQASDGLATCSQRAIVLNARLKTLISGEDIEHVRWAEVSRTNFALRSTPLVIADRFQASRAREPAAWIFSSATLAVDGRFDHFKREIGAETAREAEFDSPFDFDRQARLFLPAMPDPRAPDYRAAVIEQAAELIDASAGGAFLLCTSHAAVREYGQALRERVDVPVLQQGEQSKHALLHAFRTDGNAVLVGTQSFWEGVDVPGRALRLVMIDRLPFLAPSDPLLRARVEHLKAQGLEPFRDYQIPHAAMTLKQGAGRLIRGTEDRGGLVIFDPRIHRTGYGKAFLNSLPPFPVETDRLPILSFLREVSA